MSAAPKIDYLDHPPQRYGHVFQKASGSREMVEDPEGEWVKFDDMDLYMFEGGQLLQQAAAEIDRLRATIEFLDKQLRCPRPDWDAIWRWLEEASSPVQPVSAT